MVVITLAALIGWFVILDVVVSLLLPEEFSDIFSDEQ